MKNDQNNRIVLDTNIVISGAIFPNSVPGLALRKALEHFDVYVSESTKAELIEVIRRPKFERYFFNQQVGREVFLKNFLSGVIEEKPTVTITACKDEKDNQFLELAVSVNAFCLISGDGRDLLSMKSFRDIMIISAKEFLEM